MVLGLIKNVKRKFSVGVFFFLFVPASILYDGGG